MGGDEAQGRAWRGRLVAAGAAAVALIVVVGGVSAVAGWAGDNGELTAPAEAPFDVRVDDFGIWITTEVTFTDEVTLTKPTLHAGESHEAASLWPLDGREHEGEDLDPLTVPAGTSVELSGMLRPICDRDEITAVQFAVAVSQHDGSSTTAHYSAANQSDVPAALDRWCSNGPSVTAGMERIGLGGDAVIGVYVTNSGPNPVTVEIPAYTDEHVAWAEATAVAPPGERTRLEIHGTRVGCEPGEIASWSDGRLLLDGTPYTVTMDDAWC